jgi:hypothetical protein
MAGDRSAGKLPQRLLGSDIKPAFSQGGSNFNMFTVRSVTQHGLVCLHAEDATCLLGYSALVALRNG